jgi:hypothetical protein
MSEEEQQKQPDIGEQFALKKAKQHEAWKRWYYSPKGQAYQLKRKIKGAMSDKTS